MHSTGVLSSLLFAAAVVVAAPAAPAYTPDSPYTPLPAVPTPVKPEEPYKPTTSPVVKPEEPYKPTTTSSSSKYVTTTTSISKPEYTPDVPYKPSTTTSKGADEPSPKPKPSYGGEPAAPGGSYDIPLPPVVPINTRAGDRDFIAKLLTAPTQQDRGRLLNLPGDYVFDFNDQGAPEGSESVGKGGFTVSANSRTFPALIGNGAAMTVGFLGPCGMNTAHVHNRATEVNIVVEGSLVTNFQIENGLPSISNTLEKYQMTVFPQGAIHQEFNPLCTPSVFVAGFNNVDPGVEQIAQTFFGLRPDVVSATLDGVYSIEGADLESFRDRIPANVALGVESCLKKCGIKKNAKRDINEILGI